MIWNSGVPTRRWVEPDLVAACGLTVELKPDGFEPWADLAVAEAG